MRTPPSDYATSHNKNPQHRSHPARTNYRKDDPIVMTHSLKPHTLPNKPPLPRNLPPRRFVELPQHSAPTPANSDGPLANSDVFPAAASTPPGLPEPLGPPLRHA
ncbi:hypothetical protein J132_06665 [Termitomyces sp. J132]|nr:hypothetical protein J132_06665 [Termitomyces sp. J132]